MQLEHSTELISTITVGLVLAYLMGLAAHRLRISPLAGYLLAGIAVGPFTPGFVASEEMAAQLSEIGIVLLMFGVGLHFSVGDLLAVARVAVPAALAQLVLVGILGYSLAINLGWDAKAGVVFGLCLAVASTVVQMRALQERRLLETARGHIAVGWLVVEDIIMVLALVLVPALAGRAEGMALLELTTITLAKVAAFVALMVLVGRRAVPALLHYTAHTGSRELFRLSVFATALGFALVSATWFSASFAFGAFCAGIVLGDSKLSQRAADEALPLRDAFAVLFFVSVGMLFRPNVLIEHPLAVLAVVVIIVVFKTVSAYLTLRALGRSKSTSATLGVGRAQIGEFSFVLAAAAVAVGILPPMGQDLILSGAIISILLNPLLFVLAEAWVKRLPARVKPVETVVAPEPEPEPEPLAALDLQGHDIVAGYGRVGSLVAASLKAAGRSGVVLDLDGSALERARGAGFETLTGNSADPDLLRRAALERAARIFVTVPDPFEAGQIVEQARAASPGIEIIARAHTDADEAHLTGLGANRTIMGEREIAHRMIETAGLEVPVA